MATITENINRLKQAKADIKEAIIAKGVEVADDVRIDGYAEKIGEIQQGGGGSQFAIDYGEEIYTNNAYSMTAEQEDIDYYNQIQAERAAYAAGTGGRSDAEILADSEFKNRIAWLPEGMTISAITKFFNFIKLKIFDKEITRAGSNAFSGCYNVKMISTTLPSYTANTFNNCITLNVAKVDATICTSMVGAFDGCYSLMKLLIKGLKTDLAVRNSSLINKESLIYIYDHCQATTTAYTLALHATTKDSHLKWIEEDANYAASFAAANAKGLTIA